MTTIVYHLADNELAADSRCTAGTLIVDDKVNKFAKCNGYTFVCCWTVSDIGELISAYPYGFTEPVNLNAQAFVVDDGEVFLVSVQDGEYSRTKMTSNFAIGSGGDFALANMDHGGSARTAIMYAKTRDCATGGRIRIVKVK